MTLLPVKVKKLHFEVSPGPTVAVDKPGKARSQISTLS